MSKSPIDQIGDIVHQSFRVAQGGIGDITGIIGASQPSGEVRRELYETLATLKKQPDTDGKEAFYAQVQTARTLGMLDEVAESKINALLEEI